jgi:hypothetical protein
LLLLVGQVEDRTIMAVVEEQAGLFIMPTKRYQDR